MGIKKPVTFRFRTSEELEKKGFAVSDELIKKERELNRVLNRIEEDLLNEQAGIKE